MPSRRVPVDLNAGTYFLTLTVQRWYYLFDRHNRWPILADSIRYCREHKGLELNGYVFMLNHIHLIVTFRAGRGMPHQPRRDGASAPSPTFDPWPTVDWNRQVRRKRFGRGECPVRPMIERPSPKPAGVSKPDGVCPINRGGTGHSPRPERLIPGRPLIGTGRFGENVSDGANAPSGP